MLKKILGLSLFIVGIQANLFAQKNSILPLTGLRYFNEGIFAKSIEVFVDGGNLLSDRVPLNKEVEIKLQMPTGFTPVSGNYFAGAEVILLNSAGAVLSKTPNVFNFNEAKGFAPAAFKEVSVKIGLRPEIIKADASVTIQVRFFDLKSKNQLRLEFPVTIAKPGETVKVSKTATFIKTNDGSLAIANILKIKEIEVTLDSSIAKNPKMMYVSLEVPNVEGTTPDDILSGTETFWVYDNNLKNVKTADILLKRVKLSMQNSSVDYSLRIPYKLKTLIAQGYVVRFRWESKDKMKLFDIVVVK